MDGQVEVVWLDKEAVARVVLAEMAGRGEITWEEAVRLWREMFESEPPEGWV